MVLVAIISIGLGRENRESEIREQLKTQSWRTLELLSAGALEAVISEDIPVLDSLVREIAALDSDIYSIVISNESDQKLVEHTPFAKAEPDGVYTYSDKIEFEGEVFGSIVASWDPARLLIEVDKRLTREQIQLALSLLTLTLLSLLLLHFLVVAPLNKLRDRLLLHSSGQPTEPLNLRSSREMAMLGDAVNQLGQAVDESRTLTKELEYRANHDVLTDLANRDAFETALNNRLLDRSENDTEDIMLYIDLDQFKIVNDTSGHAAGDVLLRQLSTMFKQVVDSKDIFARLGGDEFAVLLLGTPLDRALVIAEKLRETAEDFRFGWHEQSFSVEASIGVVPITCTGHTVEDIFAAADEACYAAKDAGRNRVHVYQEEDTAVSRRRSEMSWVPRIRDAIENSKLSLYGQIIEPARANKYDRRRLEVLVRMISDDGTVLPPGAFLPAAERYGLAQHIDRWVVSTTLEWLSGCVNRGETLPVCAINLSGNSVSDNEFCQFALKSLREAPIPADTICFELTETAAVANLSNATRFMNSVKDLGCRFALDDFGAGMSSFTYLKNLPIDYIKIDGSIVRDILDDDTSIVMVRAIGDIARVMGIQSIAEFVETDQIRAKLGDIDIDYVQGYAIGRPRPLSEFESQVSEHREAG